MEVSDKSSDIEICSDLDIDSHEDKENQEVYTRDMEEAKPAYLMFEDFSHQPEGLETYTDGLKHPVEMRRILTADLSTEMTVSYRDSTEETFRSLAYPKPQKRGIEIFDSSGLSVFNTSSMFPKPPKLYKGSGNPFSTTFPMQQSSSWSESSSNLQSAMPDSANQPVMDFMSQHSAFSMGSVSPRKPGRPPTAAGSFDPETGSIRYLCRLQCGASLASAKGRRKHEKKHCPNFGKIAPPYIKGQGVTKQQHAMAMAMAQAGTGPVNFSHSLFGGTAGSSPLHRMAVKERKVYDCRYCGKILKTYEGRRLHEKLQHVAKLQSETAGYALEQPESEEVDTEDSKQLLIEHLKAAGLDPDILDESDMTQGDPAYQAQTMLGYDKDKIVSPDNDNEDDEDMGDIGVPTVEYGDDDDDDDDDEDDEDTEDPSSDGIEIIRD